MYVLFFEKTTGIMCNHISYRFIISWQEILIHIHLISQTTWIQLQVQLELSQLGKKLVIWFTRTSPEQVGGWSYWWCRVVWCIFPSGDWMRNSRPDLESVIDAGVSQQSLSFFLVCWLLSDRWGPSFMMVMQYVSFVFLSVWVFDRWL